MVAAALAGAVFTAIGIVVRQRATLDVPRDRGVSGLMINTLLHRPLWWAGTAAAVTGYGFQAVALAYGSLLLVAPLLVSALLFALPLSAWISRRRVTRAEWGWASLLTVALALFVAVARTKPGDYEASEPTSVAVATICLLVVACALSLLIVWVLRATPFPPGLWTAARLLFIGLVAVQILLLPINYGVLIMDKVMPRVASLGATPLSPGERAWLVWEGRDGSTFLVQGRQHQASAPAQRRLVTLARADVKRLEILDFDSIMPTLFGAKR